MRANEMRHFSALSRTKLPMNVFPRASLGKGRRRITLRMRYSPLEYLAVMMLVILLAGGALAAPKDKSVSRTAHTLSNTVKVPIIDVTDLYHPHQDVGDNFDLVAAYALPEIDLRAVILDAHDSFRKPVSDHPLLSKYWIDKSGPRDPGFIPVLQLNYIFNRNVPTAVGPFTMMKSPQDKMLDIPAFQQQGVELILKVLQESKEPVSILSFGSARPIAVAYNRDPKLFHAKVKQIHLSPAHSSPECLEWNEGSTKMLSFACCGPTCQLPSIRVQWEKKREGLLGTALTTLSTRHRTCNSSSRWIPGCGVIWPMLLGV